MRAELLTIGSELMSGATINTNAAYLARRLADAGISCERQVAVDDEPSRILTALREAMGRCELLITSGGLGPTFDDLTIGVIAEATGRRVVYHAEVAAMIRRFYTRRHRRLQRAALRQAYLPAGGLALPNPLGTAPGLWLPAGRTLVVALPGVPTELRAILERHVLPRLKRFPHTRPIATRTLRSAGLVELSIEAMLRAIRIPPGVQVGLYPHLRMVDIRLTAVGAPGRRRLAAVDAALRRRLGEALYGQEGDTLAGVVGALLARRGWTLALAESCTGGLLTNLLTDVPGSSRYVRGAVVAYHNALKTGALGVPPALLRRHGAVSRQVAAAMAQGARRFAQADLGLAITGIAGPGGATRMKPVGLVYLALADGSRTRVERHHFFGDRPAIKLQAAQRAMDWLRRVLRRA